MDYDFYFPKIETRSFQENGSHKYIVKGYATIPNHVYTYKSDKNGKTFKEYFTPEAIKKIGEKIKTKKVYVDVEHAISGVVNSKDILAKIKNKTGNDFQDEINYLESLYKQTDIPMFKVQDFKIDDNGLFLEIHGNPFYREIDENHQKTFDSIWGSLETGFINGMSFNFSNPKIVKINNEVEQINDIDILGISLTGGSANEKAMITEVAMRCFNEYRGEEKCQTKLNRRMILLA